jgi:hypothetical protein
MITRKAVAVLHQKLNFIGNVNRQYDDRFAVTGAKIGQTLNVRMPSKYTVRTGATLTTQDHTERSTPLSVQSQYGVDVSFTTVDLTMNMDDFSERVIEPAMAQLAARIEGDCLTDAYKLVNQYTNATTDAVMTYKYFQRGGAHITEQLGPSSQRTAILSPASQVEFNDAVKGLFHQSNNIEKQYREGMMGRTGGHDVYENTLLPSHTTGTLAGSPLTNGATLGTTTTTQNTWVSQTTLAVDGATSGTTLLAGDIITLSGVYDVQPETKVSYGKLKRFVVQSDITLTTAATSYSVVVKPGLIWGSGNAYQNCYIPGGTTDGLTTTRIGAAGTAFGQDLQFHKDAFIFASADLEDVSQYGAWGSRAVKDGISMRLAKQYAIGSDTVPCRIDVLFGFAGLYPELANRHMYDLALV